MIDLILLGKKHGYPELERAVKQALDLGCFDVSAVALLLRPDPGPQICRDSLAVGVLSRYDRPQPSLSDYDQLLQNWSAEGVMQ